MNKAIIKQTAGELSEREPLELAGQVANRAAVAHIVEEYLSRKARNTIRTQAVALDLFADYLDAAAGVGTAMRQFAAAVATWAGDENNGRPDPAAWRGVTWGIVEGFVKWLLNEGYAVTTVNNRLSAVKVYARLAMKAGAITADELQLIKAVSGYSGKEAKRIDERWPVERVGDKKAIPDPRIYAPKHLFNIPFGGSEMQQCEAREKLNLPWSITQKCGSSRRRLSGVPEGPHESALYSLPCANFTWLFVACYIIYLKWVSAKRAVWYLPARPWVTVSRKPYRVN